MFLFHFKIIKKKKKTKIGNYYGGQYDLVNNYNGLYGNGGYTYNRPGYNSWSGYNNRYSSAYPNQYGTYNQYGYGSYGYPNNYGSYSSGYNTYPYNQYSTYDRYNTYNGYNNYNNPYYNSNRVIGLPYSQQPYNQQYNSNGYVY